ncbi:hypothetical protein [Archangium violaceum]|nr:hypothetical protein [Archangium violaceum]
MAPPTRQGAMVSHLGARCWPSVPTFDGLADGVLPPGARPRV